MARKIADVKWILVSTDDMDIAREAERAGATVPFMRPQDLSCSDTPMLSVLEHAFKWFRRSMPEDLPECEGLLLLQPTSPMRRTRHMAGALELYRQARAKGMEVMGVHTVSPVPEDSAPWNIWRCVDGIKTKEACSRMPCAMQRAEEGSHRPRLYYRNCAAIVLDPDQLNALTLAAGPVIPYIINQPLLTIDTLYDLLYIEHCVGRLEPDPVEIGWESLGNKYERG